MHIDRLFTIGSLRPQDSMNFVIAGSANELPQPHLVAPDTWSLEATEAFKQALCLSAPLKHHSVEENTTPSWLWRHLPKGSETTSETSVLDVISRIAGAATYRGWTLGLWDNEVSASAFYDEVHALLLTRRLVLCPHDMGVMGLDWAYGIKALPQKKTLPSTYHTTGLILQNDTIDSILCRTQALTTDKWSHLLESSQNKTITHVAFTDTMTQWGSLPARLDTPRAAINLSAFKTHDASVDCPGLKQASRLGVLLLELFYSELSGSEDKGRAISLGFGNLSALLMSLGLAYDSKEGRNTAAAIAALITSTGTITSAELAQKLGPCETFHSTRESTLRTLRNKLRATYGERNDYEHLSIIPQTIDIEANVDLALIAQARHACGEALRLAQLHGLRNIQRTSLFKAAEMMPLMDATSCGLDAENSLTLDYAIGNEQYERRARPCLAMGLYKLGYESDDVRAIIDHVAGYHTLVAAPVINHAVLRDKGFDEATLDRIEELLPFVDHLRFAFTPWVVGRDFCINNLGVRSKDIKDPNFDLLHHLGFSEEGIAVANAFCCGHRTVRGVSEVKSEHLNIFETRNDIAIEATISMAAALQPFINGDVGLTLHVPVSLGANKCGELILKAWELGLKNVTLTIDRPYTKSMAESSSRHMMKRKTQRPSASFVGIKPQKATSLTPLQSRAKKPKAPSRSIGIKSNTHKSVARSKRG